MGIQLEKIMYIPISHQHQIISLLRLIYYQAKTDTIEQVVTQSKPSSLGSQWVLSAIYVSTQGTCNNPISIKDDAKGDGIVQMCTSLGPVRIDLSRSTRLLSSSFLSGPCAPYTSQVNAWSSYSLIIFNVSSLEKFYIQYISTLPGSLEPVSVYISEKQGARGRVPQ